MELTALSRRPLWVSCSWTTLVSAWQVCTSSALRQQPTTTKVNVAFCAGAYDTGASHARVLSPMLVFSG